MKQCSTCNRTYHDDTQSFCLEDGARLVTAYDREATHVMPPLAPPIISPTPAARVASAPRNTSPALYIAIALLALLVGGGLVALLKSRSETGHEPRAADPSPSATSSTPSPQTQRNSPSSTPALVNREPPLIVTPPSSQGTWFVVLGSFPKNSYAKATERLQSIQSSGYTANIIDTDNYPGLRPGLWAVVMGPYSKADANAMARQMKSVRSDAYPKRGR